MANLKKLLSETQSLLESWAGQGDVTFAAIQGSANFSPAMLPRLWQSHPCPYRKPLYREAWYRGFYSAACWFLIDRIVASAEGVDVTPDLEAMLNFYNREHKPSQWKRVPGSNHLALREERAVTPEKAFEQAKNHFPDEPKLSIRHQSICVDGSPVMAVDGHVEWPDGVSVYPEVTQHEKARSFARRLAWLLNEFDVDMVATDAGPFGQVIEFQWNGTGESFNTRQVAAAEDIDAFEMDFANEVSTAATS